MSQHKKQPATPKQRSLLFRLQNLMEAHDNAQGDNAREDAGQPKLWLWCPMKTETKAARKGINQSGTGQHGLRHSKATCTGIGHEKSLEFGKRLAQGEIAEVVKYAQTTRPSKLAVESLAEAGLENAKVVIVGFCGGLQDDAVPGEVIVASELRSEDGTLQMEGADKYVEHLNSHGLKARAAAVHCSKNLVYGKEREELGKTGAAVVEMESWWLIEGSADSSFRPDAVVRVVLDSHSLIGGVFKLRQASRVITQAAAALERCDF